MSSKSDPSIRLAKQGLEELETPPASAPSKNPKSAGPQPRRPGATKYLEVEEASVVQLFPSAPPAEAADPKSENDDEESDEDGDEEGLFRPEAIEYHLHPRAERRPLEITADWMSRVFWIIVLAALTSLCLGLFLSVAEHARGAGILRMKSRAEVAAPVAGNIQGIRVQPGDMVHRGDVLLELDATEEVADLRELEQAFELKLLEVLRNPADTSNRNSIADLRARMERSRARVNSKVIRAGDDGQVGTISVRLGQHVAPGDLLLSLVSPGSRVTLTVLTPAHFRPRLRVGQRIRVELRGFPNQWHWGTIQTVGNEIVGPSEAERILGPRLHDAVQVDEAVVVVSATLRETDFISDGHHYKFFDGMLATADIVVGKQRLAVELLPFLKGIL